MPPKNNYQILYLDQRNSLDRVSIYMDEKGELFAGTDIAETNGAIEMNQMRHNIKMAAGKFVRIADVYDLVLDAVHATQLVEDYKRGLPVAVDHAPWRIENHPAHALNARYPNRPKGMMALSAKIYHDDTDLVQAYERQQQILPPFKENVEMASPFSNLKKILKTIKHEAC